MLHQVGQTVDIKHRLIPACNIQVENVPGYFTHPDGTVHWYGVYFEIFFEDGALWEVSLGADKKCADGIDPDKIIIGEYTDWGNGERAKVPNFTLQAEDWEHFLRLYDAKLNRR